MPALFLALLVFPPYLDPDEPPVFPKPPARSGDYPTTTQHTLPRQPAPDSAPDRPLHLVTSVSSPEAVITSLRFRQVSDHREDASAHKHS